MHSKVGLLCEMLTQSFLPAVSEQNLLAHTIMMYECSFIENRLKGDYSNFGRDLKGITT